jgi:hypothetical protein
MIIIQHHYIVVVIVVVVEVVVVGLILNIYGCSLNLIFIQVISTLLI